MISATHLYPEEYAPIIAAGCDVSYNYYTEAGVGFARHTYETLTAPRRVTIVDRERGQPELPSEDAERF